MKGPFNQYGCRTRAVDATPIGVEVKRIEGRNPPKRGHLCVGAKRGYCSLSVCVCVCVCVCLHCLLPLNYYNLPSEALAATKV